MNTTAHPEHSSDELIKNFDDVYVAPAYQDVKHCV